MDVTQNNLQQVTGTIPTMVKDIPFDERISSWEMSQLWLIYQANSSVRCILQYFVASAQDNEIKALLNDSLNSILPQLNTMSNIFNSVGFPIPHGFTDEDVEPNAKRLYSDSLMLAYLRTITKFGIVELGHALPLATRPDVRDYLNGATVTAQNLINKTQDLMVKKGIAVKPPYTRVPDRVNYVQGEQWYKGLFGKKRPMNVLELTHVFERMETKLSERAILLGYTQTAKSEEVRSYFSKVNHVMDKEVERWHTFLGDEDLPEPINWNGDITDSSESPFSDKLMLFHFMFSVTFSVTANGFALANCTRTDLVTAFAAVILNLQALGKDGLDLMITNRWMEEIPLVVDREDIISKTPQH